MSFGRPGRNTGAGGVSRTGETRVSGRCPPMSQKFSFARSIDGSWTLHNMLTVCIFNFGQHFSATVTQFTTAHTAVHLPASLCSRRIQNPPRDPPLPILLFSNIPVDLDSRNCTKGRGKTLKKISRAPRAKQVCPGCPGRAKHGCPNEKSCPRKSFSARTCILGLGEGDTPRLRPDKILSVCVYVYIRHLCCVVRVSVSFVRHDVRAWRFVCLCSHAGMVIRPVPPDGSRPPPPQPLPNPLSKAYTVTPSTPPCWLCARMWCGGGGAVVARRLARARDPRKPTK